MGAEKSYLEDFTPLVRENAAVFRPQMNGDFPIPFAYQHLADEDKNQTEILDAPSPTLPEPRGLIHNPSGHPGDN